MKSRTIPLLLFAGLLLFSPGFAVAAGTVYYSNDFLNNGGSPRAAGMGEAMAADPGDRTAGMYNPAALLGVGKVSLFVSHANIFDGLLNHSFVAFTYPLGASRALGAYLLRSSVDDIWDTRDFSLVDGRPVYSGAQLKMVENIDYALGLSYAATAGKRLRYGGTLKLIRRKLDQIEGDGIGLDAGVQYRLPQGMMVGITGKNVAATATRYFADDWEIAPPELYPGFSIKQAIAYLYGTVEFSYQTQNLLSTSGVSRGPFGGAVDAENSAPVKSGLVNDPMLFFFGGNWGLEYAMNNRLFLRLGTNANTVYAMGLGLRLMKFNVDFAFLNHQELKGSYRFAVAWDFN